MHSTPGPSGLIYCHNSDFSGSVKVEIPVSPDADWAGNDRATASEPYSQQITQRRVVEVEIPFADLRSLVLQHLSSRLVGRLEQATDDELEAFFARLGPAVD